MYQGSESLENTYLKCNLYLEGWCINFLAIRSNKYNKPGKKFGVTYDGLFLSIVDLETGHRINK